MGILKWYRRDPNAALHGMMDLTLEERGAYNSVLDMIYAHDGALLDNEKLVAQSMGVDRRVWRRLRLRLLDKGKIYLINGHIHNERADWDAKGAIFRVEVAREAAKKRWADSRKIKGLPYARAMLVKS